jgi:NADH dehydrogenase
VRIFHPDAIIMRPSVVFGPEDQFFNRFATMARFMPALPLVGGGATKLQPVFAGEIGTVIAVAVEGEARRGTAYELGGPEIARLRRIIEFVLKVTERKRILVPVSFERAKCLAFDIEISRKLSLGPFPEILAITSDQVKLLRIDLGDKCP